MLKVEWKKLLLYQRGGLIVLVSLLAYAVLCLASGCDITNAIKQNEGAYLSYIQRWQGELNAQKETELRAEYDALNHSRNQRRAKPPLWRSIINTTTQRKTHPAAI